ncbi:NAD(P)/FAD-dependent oxidoreductase [Motilimonas sp. 1_MG-2023]|uniref:NAD(P)/FAD-dependent oxidoreductase n=1 Tax=unclassified Motilimonas TaxID=2643697 RepID=UPI001E596CAB|nr:NAD(P)/FAD-dependent oxidoreductase [Motilimonas sp. 1_MG-2023]MCE0556454.1 tryptophan 7-halogenase [Motilimonas sp. E26]MDO6527083.1 NAD(P)/FAD-dependent oxidoreductase [Motilimonas sp. 1_MG-2023]
MADIQHVQVVIIGAGPSGAVAGALLKQQGIKSVIIEKSTFPRFSIGESLLPACMEVLKLAKLDHLVEQAGFQFKNGAAFQYQQQYTQFDFTDKFSVGAGTTFQVQRACFDQILADGAAAQGVDIRYQETVLAVDLSESVAQLTIANAQGEYQINADFVLDASGFGRVLPRLLDLEQPSCLPARHALFTHIVDGIDDANYDRNKILISVHPECPEVWYWLIPFSNGTSSVGVVAKPSFLAQCSGDKLAVLQQLIEQEPSLGRLLRNAQYQQEVGEIGGYSANVSQLCSEQFALLGNAGEFLDPVFSSGVTIALRSAQLACAALVKKFAGEPMDWQQDYAEPLMLGVNTFRCYVEAWYSGELQDVIFYPNPEPKIKQMVCSILAGYAWDKQNPYVAKPRERLAALANLCAS